MTYDFTQEDKDKIREYLEKSDLLDREEPEYLSAEIWDKAWPHIVATGEVPEEYRDRIGVKDVTVYSDIDEKGNHIRIPEGKKQKGYYDIVWEAWNARRNELAKQYHDVIIRAIAASLKNMEGGVWQSERNLLQAIIDEKDVSPEQVRALLSSRYLPMLDGTPAHEIMQISTLGLKPDSFTKSATITTKDGHKVTIERFDRLQGMLSTPAKKIFDAALAYLTDTNYYRAKRGSIMPTVEIPLIEYGEACGYQLTPRKMATQEEQDKENNRVNERIKDLKKNVRRDLHDIASILWSGEETRGRNKGDYKEMRIISSHSISRGIIRINFDVDAAAYFVNAYIMQYPTVLLLHDNRNPNAYAIGRKIAYHNCNDRNNRAGTENTLSVKSLLESASDIPTIEDIKARGQRNWKDKIKKPLDAALDANIKVGFLSKWEYRDPRTGETYTAETAQPLTWTQYSRLMVDFIVIDAPDQTERRAAKAEAAAKAAEEQPKKKRGRPKKTGGV